MKTPFYVIIERSFVLRRSMKYILLSEEFYKKYNEAEYPEILHKPSRPYVMLMVEIDNYTFAIPIRSHLRHKFGFITNKETNAGLDYTKSVIILKPEYVSNKQLIKITKEEMVVISSYKKYIIEDFKRFLRTYKRKIKNNLSETLLKYSSLQYFHKELGL